MCHFLAVAAAERPAAAMTRRRRAAWRWAALLVAAPAAAPAAPPWSCAPSLRCYPGLAPLARALVAIHAPGPGGGAWCTGVLVADAGGAPAVLTADHCVASATGVPRADEWVFHFDPVAPCGAAQRSIPSPKTVTGAALRFFDAAADTALLALPGGVPSSFNATDAPYAFPDAPPPSLAVVGCPAGGGAARVALAAGPGSGASAAFLPPPAWPVAGSLPPTNATHWRVTYGSGATDRGASGGPAVDAATLRVVGTLTGGDASCAPAARGADYVGTLAAARRAGLGAFLPADGAGGRLAGGPGPVLGFSPAALLIEAAAPSATVTVFLARPLLAGEEEVRATFEVEALPGADAAADPRAAVRLAPPSAVFSAARPSIVLTVIDTMPGRRPEGGLQRFYVRAAVGGKEGSSGGARGAPTSFSSSAARLKCVVAPAPRAGIATALPAAGGTVRPPVRLARSVATPSGVAAFRWAVDASFAPPAVDARVCLPPEALPDASVAVYINGRLHALGGGVPQGGSGSAAGCVEFLGVPVAVGDAVDVAVSDSSFLDALLPASALRELAVVASGSGGAVAAAAG